MGQGAHDISHIVLSDLHLGDRDSVLTCLDQDGAVDPMRPSPALAALIECLADLTTHNQGPEPPTLVLNGDMIELAFGSVGGALNTFERMAESLFAPGHGFCRRLLFVPGNHDHHVWEMARETQYRTEVVSVHRESGGLPPPRHVTPLDPSAAVPSLLLNAVLSHLGRADDAMTPRHTVGLLYPNMALVNEERSRAVVLHHGHYVEPLYHVFSRIRRLVFPDRPLPETIHDIEAENFAWVDFVWSVLGRSGGAGEDAQRLFDLLLYPDRTRTLAVGLADRAAAVVRMPFLPLRWMRQFVLRQVLLLVARRAGTERIQSHVVCSDRTLAGLDAFLFGPTFQQLRDELGSVPAHLTFSFGHTHKPFERRRAGGDPARTVDVYNTGGWVVDALEPDPAFGGSVLLVSGDLEVACVRVFNDGTDDDAYRASVRSVDDASNDEPSGPFARRIQTLIDKRQGRSDNPWAALGAALQTEVALRRRLHHARTDLA